MTTVNTIKSDDKRSYVIAVKTQKEEFKIPIVDCRDGGVAIDAIKSQLKNNRRNAGSKYMRPSFSQMGHSYQSPRK